MLPDIICRVCAPSVTVYRGWLHELGSTLEACCPWGSAVPLIAGASPAFPLGWRQALDGDQNQRIHTYKLGLPAACVCHRTTRLHWSLGSERSFPCEPTTHMVVAAACTWRPQALLGTAEQYLTH